MVPPEKCIRSRVFDWPQSLIALIQINDAQGSLEDRYFANREIAMKQVSIKRTFLVAAVVACGVTGSVGWSQNDGLSLSLNSAQARVGRPLTPVSVAGVARRTTRRAVVGGVACVRVWVNGVHVCR
jgi:hypothetical protein